MNTLLIVAAAIFAGLLVSRLARLIGLPNVTAFLVAGLLIGPFLAGILDREAVRSLSVISDMALGFIAFSIGSEFKLDNLKKIGKGPLTITVFQGLTTAALIDLGLILLGFSVPESLLLGAIGLATAPAATLMVIRQYKAKGPVTSMLLPVVAMDDALGLMVFSISSSVASALLGGEITLSAMLLGPVIEILGSLLCGTVLGFLLSFCAGFFRSRGNKLALTLAAVLAGVGLCAVLNLSSLLVCMMIGAVAANFCRQEAVIVEQTDRFTPPLFLLFFVLSGAGLDLSVLPTVGLLGAAYLILRSIGKWLGALLGAAAVHADGNVRKYLGLTLLPQAGVAIGMSTLVTARFSQYGGIASRISAVVLAATLIYELVGPVITKIALIKAGEIPAEAK